MLSAFPNPNILPDKAVGQRSLDPQDIFFTRYLPPWMRPRTLNGDQWRAWVFNEPVCMICRETLIMQLLSLDWTIEPVDSEKRDELQGVIKYYTKLIEQGGYYYGLDYSGLKLDYVANLKHHHLTC